MVNTHSANCTPPGPKVESTVLARDLPCRTNATRATKSTQKGNDLNKKFKKREKKTANFYGRVEKEKKKWETWDRRP